MSSSRPRSPWFAAFALTLALPGCARDYEFRPAFDGGLDVTDGARTDAGADGRTDARDVAMDARDVVTDARDVATIDSSADACATTCSGACVDLQNDPDHCGTCTNTCTAPANGTAQCNAGMCAASCNTGFHPCGTGSATICAADNDPMHCGASCEVCTPPSGGLAACSAAACNISCGMGMHPCGNHCASDTSLTECGASCTPCAQPTGGTAECQSGTCVQSCVAGATVCTPDGGAPKCSSSFDPAACGPSCTVCPTPMNGTAACLGGTCAAMCNSGYHACGSACASNTDPTQCGFACTACPVPANGTATCGGPGGGTCGISCDPGYHVCNGRCYSDTDVNHCGSNCNVCNGAANGTAACDATGCTVACNAGYHVCGSRNPTCAADTDTSNCGIGGACGNCPNPAHGSPVCTMSGSTCDVTCDPGWYDNGTTCAEADTCADGPANITVPAGGMVVVNGTLAGMANDQPTRCRAGGTSDGPDVVYLVDAPLNHVLTATVSAGTNFDSRVFIATNCNVSSATYVCDFSNTTSPSMTSGTIVTPPVYVWVDSPAGSTGTYTLTLTSN